MKMFKNYVDFKNLEGKCSVILTIIFVASLYYIDFYLFFQKSESDIKSLILVVIGGLFSLLTLSIAVYSIYLTIFTNDIVDKINEIEKLDSMGELQQEFYFIAKSYGLQMICYFIVYLLISSNLPITNFYVFWLIVIFIIYITVFNICYTIELPNFIFELNKIKNKAEKLIKLEKSKTEK